MSILNTLIALLASIHLLLVGIGPLVLSLLGCVLVVILHCFFRGEILRLFLHLPLILFIKILMQQPLVTLSHVLIRHLLLLLNLLLLFLHYIHMHHRILLRHLIGDNAAVHRLSPIARYILPLRHFIIVLDCRGYLREQGSVLRYFAIDILLLLLIYVILYPLPQVIDVLSVRQLRRLLLGARSDFSAAHTAGAFLPLLEYHQL